MNHQDDSYNTYYVSTASSTYFPSDATAVALMLPTPPRFHHPWHHHHRPPHFHKHTQTTTGFLSHFQNSATTRCAARPSSSSSSRDSTPAQRYATAASTRPSARFFSPLVDDDDATIPPPCDGNVDGSLFLSFDAKDGNGPEDWRDRDREHTYRLPFMLPPPWSCRDLPSLRLEVMSMGSESTFIPGSLSELPASSRCTILLRRVAHDVAIVPTTTLITVAFLSVLMAGAECHVAYDSRLL